MRWLWSSRRQRQRQLPELGTMFRRSRNSIAAQRAAVHRRVYRRLRVGHHSAQLRVASFELRDRKPACFAQAVHKTAARSRRHKSRARGDQTELDKLVDLRIVCTGDPRRRRRLSSSRFGTESPGQQRRCQFPQRASIWQSGGFRGMRCKLR